MRQRGIKRGYGGQKVRKRGGERHIGRKRGGGKEKGIETEERERGRERERCVRKIEKSEMGDERAGRNRDK